MKPFADFFDDGRPTDDVGDALLELLSLVEELDVCERMPVQQEEPCGECFLCKIERCRDVLAKLLEELG